MNIGHGYFTSLFGSGKFRTYHIDVAKAVGGIHAAILLEYIISWSETTDEEWVFRTMAQITDDTCLSRPEQETARKKLRACGVLDEQIMGLPGKLYFKVSHSKFVELMQAISSHPRMLESSKQACWNPASKDAGIQQPINKELAKKESRVKEQSNNSLPSLSQKYPVEFEEFWSAYPTGNYGKGSKSEALRFWKKLNHDAVMDSLLRWKDSDQWREGYSKHAFRWLRDGLWEETPPVTQTKPNGKIKGPDFMAQWKLMADEGPYYSDDEIIDTTGSVR